MDPSLSILADVEALLARGPGDRLLHLRESDDRRAKLAAAAAEAKAKRDAAVLAVWQRMRPGVLVRVCFERRPALPAAGGGGAPLRPFENCTLWHIGPLPRRQPAGNASHHFMMFCAI